MHIPSYAEARQNLEALSARVMTGVLYAEDRHNNHAKETVERDLLGRQIRKYSAQAGESVLYVEHVVIVAELVRLAGGDEDQIIAALLHDTVEDTKTTLADVTAKFGQVVGKYVDQCTDEFTKAKYPDLNRAKRLAREHKRDRLPKVQTIKLADILHNLSGMSLKAVGGFAVKYFCEKRDALPGLTRGDKKLYRAVESTIDDFLARVKR